MNVGEKGQIEFPELLFGMSWEDPESDRRALKIQPGEVIVTITSGGCNTLDLLLEDPARIFAVDINPCQSYLLELKCAAIRRLDHDDLMNFLGWKRSRDRLEVFESLQSDLSAPALAYWRGRARAINNGAVCEGRYERFLRYFRRLVYLIQGRRRIDGLFGCQSIEEQREYFDRVWNTAQWRLLFRLMFNKQVLARRGLSADYFRFDDGSASFTDSFFQRSKRALREIPIGTNYFMAQYLLGTYISKDAAPAHLRKAQLAVIKERLNRIHIITADLKVWLAAHEDDSFDKVSLSNICELMNLAETERTFMQVARTVRPGSRICFRNLMIPREVPASLRAKIQLLESESRQLKEQDRSFAYSRVDAYLARK